MAIKIYNSINFLKMTPKTSWANNKFFTTFGKQFNLIANLQIQYMHNHFLNNSFQTGITYKTVLFVSGK